LEAFITTIHGSKDSKKLMKITRQSVVVPQLVEHMAAYDAQLVKLTTLVRDKHAVGRLIKQGAARDFRIQDKKDDDDGDDGEDGKGKKGKGGGKKRKA
jgi:hypothetical protein